MLWILSPFPDHLKHISCNTFYVSYYIQTSVVRHIIIAIVTTEWGWSVLFINERGREGQWVNAFSMAIRLALGRDEVERLTQKPKGQVTPEHYSRPSLNSAGHPEERPPSTHTSPCMQLEAPAVRRRNRGKEGGRGREGTQLTGCDPVPGHSFTPIHPSHTLYLLSIILSTFSVYLNYFPP